MHYNLWDAKFFKQINDFSMNIFLKEKRKVY